MPILHILFYMNEKDPVSWEGVVEGVSVERVGPFPLAFYIFENIEI
jgi:hypothetical protein